MWKEESGGAFGAMGCIWGHEGPGGLQVEVSKGSCVFGADGGYLGGILSCSCNPPPQLSGQGRALSQEWLNHRQVS